MRLVALLVVGAVVAATAADAVADQAPDGHTRVEAAGARGRQSMARRPPYVAGNTLVWTRDHVTYRLEADVALDRALELARATRQ